MLKKHIRYFCSILPQIICYKKSCQHLLTIDHFTVACSATWPVDGSEARVDLVLIQTSLFLLCKCTLLTSEQLVLHNKRSEVCIKTRSTLASLSSKGQVTKQTTVKWSIENTDSDLKLNVLHYANELLVRLRLSFCKLAKRAVTIRNYLKLGWIQCSDEGLTLEPSAVKYLYFGQFILQLIKPYYLLGQNWLWL